MLRKILASPVLAVFFSRVSCIAGNSKTCASLSKSVCCWYAVVCQVVISVKEGFLAYCSCSLPFHVLHGYVTVELGFFTPSRLAYGSKFFPVVGDTGGTNVCVVLGPHSFCPLFSLPALHVSWC